MPLWNIDIEKLMGGEYWTNRYIVEADTLAQASEWGQDIAEYERLVHKNVVTFTKMRASDRVPLTDNYVVVPLNVQGAAGLVGTLLPLFNVVRVDFGTGSGRPSRKFLRLPVGENDQDNGQLSADAIASINQVYVQPLVVGTYFVDVDGEQIVNGTVHPKVGMRQLRRGSRRKLQPILP